MKHSMLIKYPLGIYENFTESLVKIFYGSHKLTSIIQVGK